MDIETIDRRRERVGLTQAELCERAGVNAVTYCRLKSGTSGGRVSTFRRLEEVLTAFEAALGAEIERAGGTP